MPEPSPNGVDIDSRLQQVRRRCVTNDVGADPLTPQRRHCCRYPCNVPLDQGVNTVTCERFATAVEEQRRLCGPIRCETAQLFDRLAPEGTAPLLVPLAQDPHGFGMPIDIADPQRCDLADTRTGIVEELRQSQQGMVARPLAR